MDSLHARQIPPGRGIYCNRTLNLRSIRAIGYDMDYTLIHYNVEEWERCAYEFIRSKLLERGWPVGDLEFDPQSVIRGLVIDLHRGNLLKANRFGYVKRVEHGGKALDFDAQRRLYGRTTVDLSESRWVFLNTFFSLSEACIYSQLVGLVDAGKLGRGLGYADMYRTVRASLDAAHMEGELKGLVLADPQRFIEPDPQTPLTLLDQKQAGKHLMLITNSEWEYTQSVMKLAFDPHLPGEMTWRDLFEVVVVAARKPSFFFESAPIFEVDDASGLLAPLVGKMKLGKAYLGGHASLVEEAIGTDGSSILYVGDHIYGDVHVSKAMSRWRTAVILREVEQELASLERFEADQRELERLMDEKEDLELRLANVRLATQRREHGREPLAIDLAPSADAVSTRARENDESAKRGEHEESTALRDQLAALDEKIGPLARRSGSLHNERWGLALRTGNDKSHLARQIERHADIYTSRVSNFLYETPFAYFRSRRGSLPHDPRR